jgi:dolichol-phosphate mannosyltransferase
VLSNEESNIINLNGIGNRDMIINPEISLIIPVYNEQDNLKKLFEEVSVVLDRINSRWEIIFVDDASTDDSLGVIKAISRNHPKVGYLSFEENGGQSAAFCAGFDAARAEIVITMDADLQNDPVDIPGMLETYLSGYDMVIGNRVVRHDKWPKRIGSKIANFIRNKLTDESVRDTGCSLKIMRLDMAKRLPRFNGMHRFLPTLMKMEGAKVAEQAVNHRPRYSGKSKYGNWNRAISGFYDLLGVRWLKKRHFSCRIKEKKLIKNNVSA